MGVQPVNRRAKEDRTIDCVDFIDRVNHFVDGGEDLLLSPEFFEMREALDPLDDELDSEALLAIEHVDLMTVKPVPFLANPFTRRLNG